MNRRLALAPADWRSMAIRLTIAALACCVAALISYLLLRGIYGQRPTYVYVRWSPKVTDSQRRSLEHEHRLTKGEYREDTTWKYLLTDLSTNNIRALVQDPAAEDTHYLDRTAFSAWPTAPRGDYLDGGAIPRALETSAVVLPGVAMLALLVAGLGFIGPPALRASRPFWRTLARLAADPLPVPVTDRRHQPAAAVLGALCIAAAVVPGLDAVRGVTLPHDIDEFRDIAAAQAFADGKGLQDPPIMFFLLGAILFNAWAALLALAVFLFSPGYVGAVTPSYSPWLYPVTFTSAMFYLGVIACWAAIGARVSRAWITTGIMLGITFLGHTAPAMILGVCVLTAAYMSSSTLGARTRRALTAVAVAFVVSLPLLASIAGHYWLQILNPAPATFVLGLVDIRNAWNLLTSAVNLPNLLALIGLAAVLRDRGRRNARALLIAWGLTACGLFLYGWLLQLMPNRLPSLVPQFHFYFYIRALGYLLTGLGVWSLIRWLVRKLVQPRWTAVASSCAAAVVAAIAFAAWYPEFQHRRDFGGDRSEAVSWTKDFGKSRLLMRLRQQTPRDAVVLANADNAIYRVAPAGRAVVAVRAEFSNPYVNHDRRRRDQERMLSALLSGDVRTFRRLAQAYGVTHVLLGPDEITRLDSVTPRPGLRELSREGGYSILSVEG